LTFDLSWAHRQHQGNPVQHLALGDLIDADHHRALGVQIPPDHVADPGLQRWSGGDLKPLAAVRLEANPATSTATESRLTRMPQCRASQPANRRADQCVTPRPRNASGGGVTVATKTSGCTSGVITDLHVSAQSSLRWLNRASAWGLTF
jgi:hypothetical protein